MSENRRRGGQVNPEGLALHRHHGEIEAALTDPSVRTLVITAPTGSGKSILMPFIMDRLIQSGALPYGKAMISQPLRITADDLRHTISATMGKRVGLMRGGVGGHQFADDDWLIGTAGSLQFMVGTPGFRYYIWDEAHDERLEHTVIRGRLKALLERDPDVKVVVMSATMNAEEYREFFGKSTTKVVSFDTREFPREDVEEFIPGSTFADQLEQFADVVARHAKKRLTKTNENALVFVPSPMYFKKLVDILTKALPGMEILAYWSRTPNKDYVLRGGDEDRPSVIICTDVFRTGLTADRVRLVVSSGWQVRPWYNAALGIGGTHEEPTDRQSLWQELGRAARLGPGWGVYIHAENRPEKDIPATERHALSQVVLQLISMGEDPYTFYWGDYPDDERLEEAVRTLRDIGALTDMGELTPLGEVIAQFDYAPQLAKMLYQANIEGCLEQMLVIVHGMAGRNLYTNTKEHPEHAAVQQAFQDPRSDYLSVLKVWRKLCAEVMAELPYAELRIHEHYERLRLRAKDNPAIPAGSLEVYLADLARQEDYEASSILSSPFHLLRLFRECAFADQMPGVSRWYPRGVYQKSLVELADSVLDGRTNISRVKISGKRLEVSLEQLLNLPEPDEEMGRKITRCVLSGMPGSLLRHIARYSYEVPAGVAGEVSIHPASAVFTNGGRAAWLSARVIGRRGCQDRYWAQDVHIVDHPMVLAEVAPHLYEVVLRSARSYGLGDTIYAEYALVRKGSRGDLVTVSSVVEEGSSDFLKAVSLVLTGGGYTNLHPQAGSNSRALDQARTRCENHVNRWPRVDNTVLASVYEEKLASCQTLADVRQTDISLSVEDMARVLGVPDLSEILAREPEPEAEKQSASENRIRTISVQVEKIGQRLVTIYQDGEALINLLPEQLLELTAPPSIPDASAVRIEILGIPLYESGHTFPGEDFTAFQQEVRRVYESHLWSNFTILNRRSLAMGAALPALPDSKVWNTLTGALAYPAWKDTGWEFRLEWFKEESEAEAAQRRTEAEVAKRVQLQQQRAKQEQAKQLKRLLEQDSGARTAYNELEGRKSQLQKQLESLETAAERAANALGEAEEAVLAWLDVVGKTPLEIVPHGTALSVSFTEQEVSVGGASHLVSESWYSWAVLCNIAVALPIVNGFRPKSGEEVLVRVVWSSNPQKPWAMSEGAGSGTTRTYFCELVLTPEVIRAQSVLLKEQLATVERQQRELLERLENRLRTKRGQESSRLQPVEDLAYLMETTGAPPSLAHSANLKR